MWTLEELRERLRDGCLVVGKHCLPKEFDQYSREFRYGFLRGPKTSQVWRLEPRVLVLETPIRYCVMEADVLKSSSTQHTEAFSLLTKESLGYYDMLNGPFLSNYEENKRRLTVLDSRTGIERRTDLPARAVVTAKFAQIGNLWQFHSGLVVHMPNGRWCTSSDSGKYMLQELKDGSLWGWLVFRSSPLELLWTTNTRDVQFITDTFVVLVRGERGAVHELETGRKLTEVGFSHFWGSGHFLYCEQIYLGSSHNMLSVFSDFWVHDLPTLGPLLPQLTLLGLCDTGLQDADLELLLQAHQLIDLDISDNQIVKPPVLLMQLPLVRLNLFCCPCQDWMPKSSTGRQAEMNVMYLRHLS